MFLRIAIVDADAMLCITVPPTWTVSTLKQHLQHGLRALLHVNSVDLQVFAASETTMRGRRWISFSDADAVALLQGHVTDRVQQLMTKREMDDSSCLRDFGFDERLDAVHLLVRRSKIARHEAAWVDLIDAHDWLLLLPWMCLFFTAVLGAFWLDTVVTWIHQCQSNVELVRNLPWIVVSTILFVGPIVVYMRAIVTAQPRKGYAEIA